MYESTKTSKIRSEGFKRTYLSGRIIDIGCGPDLVVPHAVPFDVDQGDAEHVLNYFPPESFDCVHSSHCLEHMRDVRAALSEWWSLVKPGGYLVVVVPDEDRYEQGFWPSIFNQDHKARFHLGKRPAAADSYDIKSLVDELPGAESVEACIQDHAFDYRLLRQRRYMRWMDAVYRKLFILSAARKRVFQYLSQKGLSLDWADLPLARLEEFIGVPIDQTLGDALAQIQIVAQKGISFDKLRQPPGRA